MTEVVFVYAYAHQGIISGFWNATSTIWTKESGGIRFVPVSYFVYEYLREIFYFMLPW